MGWQRTGAEVEVVTTDCCHIIRTGKAYIVTYDPHAQYYHIRFCVDDFRTWHGCSNCVKPTGRLSSLIKHKLS